MKRKEKIKITAKNFQNLKESIEKLADSIYNMQNKRNVNFRKRKVGRNGNKR